MTIPRMGHSSSDSTQLLGAAGDTLRRSPRVAALRLLSLLLLLFCQTVACGPAREQPATTQQAQSSEDVTEAGRFLETNQTPGRIHVVQANETLYSLAQKYYGSGQQYTRIYYANRNRLTNPRNLTVGMKLIIP
jgi:LysM repeat protein